MSSRWPNLQELIDSGGAIKIGQIAPAMGAAVAIQERQVYAMLRIVEHEPLPEILDRLDAAVARAIKDEIYTDEINR